MLCTFTASFSHSLLQLTALLLCLLPCYCYLLLLLQFVHLLFCLELYLLSPFMRRYIRNASLTAHLILTAAMVAAAVLLLLPLSRVITAAFVSSVIGVSFVCPYWLVHIQKFKAKINGPWDEAVPKIPTSIHSSRSSKNRNRWASSSRAAAAVAEDPSGPGRASRKRLSRSS